MAHIPFPSSRFFANAVLGEDTWERNAPIRRFALLFYSGSKFVSAGFDFRKTFPPFFVSSSSCRSMSECLSPPVRRRSEFIQNVLRMVAPPVGKAFEFEVLTFPSHSS